MREKRIESGKILVHESSSGRLVPRTELDEDLLENRREIVRSNASVSRTYPFFVAEKEREADEQLFRLMQASQAREAFELADRWLQIHPYNMLFRVNRMVAMSIMPATDRTKQLEACLAEGERTLAMNQELRSGQVSPNVIPEFDTPISDSNHDHIAGMVHYNLAEWLEELGRSSEAEGHAALSVELLPQKVSKIFAYSLLAGIRHRACDRAGAESAKDRARSLDPDLFAELESRLLWP